MTTSFTAERSANLLVSIPQMKPTVYSIFPMIRVHFSLWLLLDRPPSIELRQGEEALSHSFRLGTVCDEDVWILVTMTFEHVTHAGSHINTDHFFNLELLLSFPNRSPNPPFSHIGTATSVWTQLSSSLRRKSHITVNLQHDQYDPLHRRSRLPEAS